MPLFSLGRPPSRKQFLHRLFPEIDDGEGASVPFGLRHDAVAGDPGLIMDNGDPLPGDPVEQGGFTDVGTTDNGDEA